MGVVNYGDQAISFDYKTPGKSETFNKLNYLLFPTGIYNGGLITKSDSTNISIAPSTMYINDSTTGVGVRIETTTAITKAVSAGSPYLIARYSWSNTENSYADILATDFASILVDDLIIGRCTYIGGVLQEDFDYTRKSNPVLNELKANKVSLSVIPKEPNANTVYIESGNLIVSGNLIEFAGGDSPAMSDTDATNSRIDLVYLDSNGDAQVLEGTLAVIPDTPSFPDGTVLAIITRPVDSTYVTGSMIDNLNPLRESSKKTTTADVVTNESGVIFNAPEVYSSYNNTVQDPVNLTTTNWTNTSSIDSILNESINNHLFTEVKNTTTVEGYVAQTFIADTFTNTQVLVSCIIRKGTTEFGVVEFYETSSKLNIDLNFDTKVFTVTAGTLINTNWLDDYTVQIFAITDSFTITNSSELRLTTGSVATTGSTKFTEVMIVDETEYIEYPFVEVSYTQALMNETFNLPNDLTFDLVIDNKFPFDTTSDKVFFSYYIDATHRFTVGYDSTNDMIQVYYQDGTLLVTLASSAFDDGTALTDINQLTRIIGSIDLLGGINDSRLIIIPLESGDVYEDSAWSGTPDNKTSIFTALNIGHENNLLTTESNIQYLRFYDSITTDTISNNIDANKIFINKQPIFESVSTDLQKLDIKSGTDFTTALQLVTENISRGYSIQDKVIQTRHFSNNAIQAFTKGMFEVTLSEYDTDAEPVIKAGSVFENSGSIINIDSDTTPSGYADITVSTTFYVVYDKSTEEFIYTITAPTWSDDKQGWYNIDDRYLFSMYKDSGGTLYQSKAEIPHISIIQLKSSLKLHGDLSLYDGSVNQDRNIEFASDASLLWDESEDTFKLDKSLDILGTINTGLGNNEVVPQVGLFGTQDGADDYTLQAGAIGQLKVDITYLSDFDTTQNVKLPAGGTYEVLSMLQFGSSSTSISRVTRTYSASSAGGAIVVQKSSSYDAGFVIVFYRKLT